jgi:putative N6-adenine-specific DNA methylase
MDLIIKTQAGLEELLLEELNELTGKQGEILQRAVRLDEAESGDVFKINYLSRLATHVLWILKEGTASDEQGLYDLSRTVDWHEHMKMDQTFAIYPTISSPRFAHTGFAALKVKDAIADHFRDRFGRRPNVDKEAPDIPINIHIYNERATLSLNTSGDPLYHRGYKIGKGIATLNEVLAYGMIRLSGWTPDEVFYDPMCGTGTLPIEAALWAKNIPAQRFRLSFAFESFYSLDIGGFRTLKRQCARQSRSISHPIIGGDTHPEAMRLSKKNAMQARLGDEIQWIKSDFFDTDPPTDKGVLIMNPPYSERMNLADEKAFYMQIGDKLKQDYSGWTAWVLSGNPDAIKRIGLKPSKKLILYNGPIECDYRSYELY